MKKKSQFVSENPVLMKQWEWEANQKIGLSPDKISCGSQKKAYWVCAKHKSSYHQIIRARYREQIGCAFCKEEQLKESGRSRYIKGKKVLAETHPALVDEWVSCNEIKYTPYTSLAGSNVKVSWHCKKCGGDYDSTISNRALHGAGCPYCSGQKVLQGYNDLATLAPDLAQEWSSKNEISPNDVTIKSNKKVYWICKIGHKDYLSSLKQRSMGQGCPECAKYLQTSFPEQAILFYTRKLFSDALNRYSIDGFEIDIYIPSISTGIEYNGIYYHREKKEKDNKKKSAMEDRGIKLIWVEETDKPISSIYSQNDTFLINERYDLLSLSALIQRVLLVICPENSIIVDCEKDRIAINEQYINSIKEGSIIQKNPNLAKEWDTSKNGNIKPEYVSYGSNQKFYWVCSKCGHSYLASPKERNRGKGCTFCSGKMVISGINDLQTRYPEIALEWDIDKNGNITPEKIYATTGYKAWWKCKTCGGEWQTAVVMRTAHHTGCPYCAGRLAIVGKNDLASTHPEILSEWDYGKNSINPYEVKAGSNKKVWWICKNNHSFLQPVSIHMAGNGCPYCSNHFVMKGFNDLTTINPSLANEWDWENNCDEKPDMFTFGSHRSVWWKCPSCGHHWKAKIVSRNSRTGCPKCHHKYWEE